METVPSPLLDTARSRFESALKNPTATEIGNLPTTISTGASVKPITISKADGDNASVKEGTTAKSEFESLLKSPTAIAVQYLLQL